MNTSLGIGPPGESAAGTCGGSGNTGDGRLSYESERDLVARCIPKRYWRSMRNNEIKLQPTRV